MRRWLTDLLCSAHSVWASVWWPRCAASTISAWKGAKPCQTNPQDGHDSGISWTIMNSVLIVSVPRKQVDLRTCGCHEIRHFVVNINFLLPKCWTGISTDLIWKTVATEERMTSTICRPRPSRELTASNAQGRISTLKRKTLFGGSFATFAHRTLSNCGQQLFLAMLAWWYEVLSQWWKL